GTAATVTVSLPGATAQMLTVAPGAESYATFPQGTIGGPVTISSDQPVLASQRVQFQQTFNEVWAQSATQAATTSFVNWYDKASAGMFNDNIHVLNPGRRSGQRHAQPARLGDPDPDRGRRCRSLRQLPPGQHRRPGHSELDAAGPGRPAGPVLLDVQRDLGGLNSSTVKR